MKKYPRIIAARERVQYEKFYDTSVLHIDLLKSFFSSVKNLKKKFQRFKNCQRDLCLGQMGTSKHYVLGGGG